MNRRQKLVQKQFLSNEEGIIKRLDVVYKKSLSDIEDKIRHLTFTIGKLQTEYDWLDDDDPEKVRIKSMIQSKIYQKNFQEQLQVQLEGILQRMHVGQVDNITDYLDTCYSDAFIGNVFDSHGQGVPITMPIDQQSMVRAVQLESKISKGLYTRLGEDVNLLKKKITAQVSRSIASGLTYAQTAKALEGYTRIGYNRAIRIARTEGHRIQTTATMDAMHAAKEMGADVVKQWDSTLDTKTRESHVHVDGEIRDLDKPFSNGLMYPGDPAGGAAEVVNCRCALLQRAKWAVTGKDQSFTKYNGISKQIESFESPETYGEFKTAFFSKGNRRFMRYVEQMQDKYGTRDWRYILEKMSEREYKHYSKLLANNPVYNKHPKVEVPKPKPTDPYSFTDDQSEAIRWYVSGEGQFINQYHRGRVGSDFGELSDMEKELSGLLDDATQRALPDDIHTLYRAVDAEAVFGGITDMQYEALRSHLLYGDNQKYTLSQLDGIVEKTKGKTITEKGFMSTTKSRELATEWGGFTGSDKPIVLLFDEVPKGVQGADLKRFDIEGDEQFEVLLARDTDYEVIDIFGEDGTIFVRAKLKPKS